MPSVRKCLIIIVLIIVLISAACFTGMVSAETATATRQTRAASAEGLAAWQKIYSVLMHPRCLNCHTATDYPQQGDDRHRHQFNVVRGTDGRGVPGLSCATCHQGATSKATGGPNCADCHKAADLSATGVPGGHGWHLAPLSMAWQDSNDKHLSSAQVCRIVTDRSRNENMGGPELLAGLSRPPADGESQRPGDFDIDHPSLRFSDIADWRELAGCSPSQRRLTTWYASAT